MNKFKLKDGQLSQYAFLCGYVQEKEISGIQLQLYHEGCVWQVRAHDFNRHKRILWESFDQDRLTEARKLYKQLSVKLF